MNTSWKEESMRRREKRHWIKICRWFFWKYLADCMARSGSRIIAVSRISRVYCSILGRRGQRCDIRPFDSVESDRRVLIDGFRYVDVEFQWFVIKNRKNAGEMCMLGKFASKWCKLSRDRQQGNQNWEQVQAPVQSLVHGRPHSDFREQSTRTRAEATSLGLGRDKFETETIDRNNEE